MEQLTEEELIILLDEKKAQKRQQQIEKRRHGRKMKSGKRALFLAFALCAVLIAFTMAMIFSGKDTTSLTILATSGVGILPIMYAIYTQSETKINLKHMEENYIENYDEKRGIY